MAFTPETNTIIMFLMMFIGIFSGYQLAFVLSGVGLLYGVFLFGLSYINTLTMAFFNVMQNYVLLAIPLFVLMGNIMQDSGAGKKIYDGFYVLLGKLNGGLLLTTNALATLFGACTGVVGASVTTVGTLSLPAMMERGYDKKLAAGMICAGGCLGVLIPPSIMIVVYGPIAGISVGGLFMSVMTAGLILSAFYMVYTAIRCNKNPNLGLPISEENREKAIKEIGLKGIVFSIIPPLFIMIAVLGSIFFGIAAPTEAAAVGVVASIILGLAYKNFHIKDLKKSLEGTLITSSMILTMSVGAIIFISTFNSLGGIGVVSRFILGLPFGKWGIFLLMFIVTAILGMFLDWIGIVYLVVPLFTPIAAELGFNPLWFATMMILFLQFSYLTPPFALAVFYFRSISPPEFTTGLLYRAVVPFIIIQVIVFLLLTTFPGIVLWLPNMMS